MGGQTQRALNLLEQMKLDQKVARTAPDLITYTSAITACGAEGEVPPQGARESQMKARRESRESSSLGLCSPCCLSCMHPCSYMLPLAATRAWDAFGARRSPLSLTV